jgi:hypothetical protein
MKTFHPKSGRFTEQPFFKPGEIEDICRDELEKHGLFPSDPEPIRIDRFIEKRFGVSPTYEDLPNGLLGFTRFGAKGVEEIVVARQLDDEGTIPAERRLRTTLAHEAGHGLLHAHLFALGARPESLFGDGLATDALKVLCREGEIEGAPTAGRAAKKKVYRWYEFQADMAMGILLLPKPLVAKALAPFFVSRGLLDQLVLPGERREEAARSLAEIFNVNPVVTRIRLQGLYPASSEQQLTL